LIVAKEEGQSSTIQRVLKRLSGVSVSNYLPLQMREVIEKQIKKVSAMLQSGHQVTKEFATNIYEIKMSEEVKVRVIQPAKNFYMHAIQTFFRIGEGRSLPIFL
jgi:hypothetical protein